MKRYFVMAAIAAATALVGCTEQQMAQSEALNRAQSRKAYVPQNSLDFANYDRRQRMSDDPTTILWCTAAFPLANVPLVTYPIVGKLTSGGKRPFDSDPGPDGMYGSSGEYRYGFTPGGVMVDFYGAPTVCSTEPTVWQREKTEIIIKVDKNLSAATKMAERHLKAGGASSEANAEAVLLQALGNQ
jgi:hypothetical protein